jgi:hypothetical protein
MSNTITKPSFLPFVMKTGLLLGILQIVALLIEYYTGDMAKGGSIWLGLIYYVIYGAIAIILLKKFRNNQFGGYITFSKAFSITLLCFIVAGILSAVFGFFFIHLFHPGIVEEMLKTQEAKLVSYGVPDERIESQMKLSRMMATNPAIFISTQVLSGAILGVIMGIIAGVICKKEPYNNIVSE